jgi:flagella basal body P-ring formation protein FlgA
MRAAGPPMPTTGRGGSAAVMLLTVAAMMSTPSFAADPSTHVPARIWANDVHALQESLLSLADERLRPAGLAIGREHAWMSLSGSFPGAGTFSVQPAWDAGTLLPSLPLTFGIWPDAGAHSAAARFLTASLSVRLLREVRVAKRRLRKGSAVTCDDLQVERRDVRTAPAGSMKLPCDIASGSVALRDITIGDVVRGADVGEALAVSSGAPVEVSVAIGAINVTIAGVALADARAGDEIEVRLQRPARILKARVTGPGSAKLVDRSL